MYFDMTYEQDEGFRTPRRNASAAMNGSLERVHLAFFQIKSPHYSETTVNKGQTLDIWIQKQSPYSKSLLLSIYSYLKQSKHETHL